MGIQLKYIFLILGLILIPEISCQSFEIRHKVVGQVFEVKSGKPLKRVPITVLPYNREVKTDSKGGFIFDMPEGSFSLLIDYHPFERMSVDIQLRSDTVIQLYLKTLDDQIYIEEVDVIAMQSALDLPENIRSISRSKLLQMPAVAGEKDIIKYLALSAGVTSSSEGAADLQVRAGLPGQNMYLQDGVPLYASSHFFGMISVYNPLTVQSAQLFKSGFPVEYGGRLSSVVNIKTRQPSLSTSSFETEISLLASKMSLSFPVIKDKLAFTASGRIANYGLININSFYGDNDDNKLFMSFSDVNAGLLWKPGDNDKLRLNWFRNIDITTIIQTDFSSDTEIWMKNRQNNLSLIWDRNTDIYENEFLLYRDVSGFDFGMTLSGKSTNFNLTDQIMSGIKVIGFKEKLKMGLGDKIQLVSGINLDKISFTPMQFHYIDSVLKLKNLVPASVLYEGAAFSSIEYKPNANRTISLGLRAGAIYNDHLIPLIEPRIKYTETFKSGLSIQASIDRMSQSVHRIANSGLGYPFEIYLPSVDGIEPSTSWMYSLGAAKDLAINNTKIALKAEVWLKNMKNIVEFKDGYDALTSIVDKFGISSNLKNVVTQGNGTGYGMDESAEMRYKKLSLFWDYTLMRSTNQFEELNNGIAFSAPTDIRHSVSLTGSYKLNENWSVSANWQFRTGKPITLPEIIYSKPGYNIETGELNDSQQTYEMITMRRSNFRTRSFHKLDLEMNYKYKAFKKYDGNISFGIYNVYNQHNPFIYLMGQDENSTPDNPKYVVKSMSVFPIMPTFNWSLRF